MTIAEERVQAPEREPTPETIAISRLAGLRASGVAATARPWDRWLLDGQLDAGGERPWLVIAPDDVTIEIIFGAEASLVDARGVLLRLLADRWQVVVRIHPSLVPDAFRVLGDVPIRIDRWDRF